MQATDCYINSRKINCNAHDEEKGIQKKRRRYRQNRSGGRAIANRGLMLALFALFSSLCLVVYSFSFPLPTRIQHVYKTSLSAYRIQPDQLEQLKESVDIVSAIESFGLPRFRRSGEHRATAICPFHDDKNPSLSIDGKRKMYKCFSCGAGGDIFQFVREYNKVSQGDELSYYQAVRLVNEQFANDSPLPLLDGSGGEASFMNSEEMKLLAAEKERLLLCNAAAAAYYANCLISPQGGSARSHISSRGLTASTVRTFAIGFAPDAYFGAKQSSTPREWGEGSLVHHLRDRGFSAQEIRDAGLAIPTKRSVGPKQSNSELGKALINNENATNVTNGENWLDLSSIFP